jgi:hypothetical protein
LNCSEKSDGDCADNRVTAETQAAATRSFVIVVPFATFVFFVNFVAYVLRDLRALVAFDLFALFVF